jgi:ABC-type multidrug transport system fused ATPase/permease subunit
VLGSGRIVDIGTHEQLLRRCDLYRRLHDLQFKEIA